MNVVCLLGRLTATPELKTTQSGVSVTSFSVAVDRTYQPKGAERQTDFINCVAWRNTAEFLCRYFQKGQRIALQGSLQSRSYTDKNGNNRTVGTLLPAPILSLCRLTPRARPRSPMPPPAISKRSSVTTTCRSEDHTRTSHLN